MVDTKKIDDGFSSFSEAQVNELSDKFRANHFIIPAGMGNNLILHMNGNAQDVLVIRHRLKDLGIKPVMTNVPIADVDDSTNNQNTLNIPTIFLYDAVAISQVADYLGIKDASSYSHIDPKVTYRYVDRPSQINPENPIRCISVTGVEG